MRGIHRGGKKEQEGKTQIGREQAGVACLVRNDVVRCVRKVEPKGSRMIVLKLRGTVPATVIGVYAPTAEAEWERKCNFYEQLSETVKQAGYGQVMIGGDWNTRLWQIQGQERDVCGPWAFGSQEAYEAMGEATRESRALMIDFCREHRMVIQNTRFQKPEEKKCTFREWGAEGREP